MKKKRPELYRNEIKSYIVRAGMTIRTIYLVNHFGGNKHETA